MTGLRISLLSRFESCWGVDSAILQGRRNLIRFSPQVSLENTFANSPDTIPQKPFLSRPQQPCPGA